jgi:type I restriction enzyme M protein
MPKGEFFNTDISTYLWVLNRSKPAARRGRVLLINAESCFVKLKRNLNKKNCEIDAAGRDQIVEAFKAFADGPMSRVLALNDLLYNKVEIAVRRLDSEGRSIEQPSRIVADAIELLIDGLEFSVEAGELDAGQFEGMDPKEAAVEFNALVKQAERIEVFADGVRWRADLDSGRVTMEERNRLAELGLGRLVPKARVAKARGALVLKVDVSLEPLIEKQIETVPFVDDEELNRIRVQEHLAKWVSEPGAIVKMTTGCSVNFNRIFPKLSGGRSIREVLDDMERLNDRMAKLEAEFQSSLEGL